MSDDYFVQPDAPDRAFVGTGGKRSEPSNDLLRGVTLVDRHGKVTGMNAPPPGMFGRCPHGQNANACLACFHSRGQPRPVNVPPEQRTMPALHPIVAAVRARAGVPDVVPGVPQVAGPVHVGVQPDGTPVEAPKPKTRIVGTMPVPVQAGQAGVGAAQSKNSLTPFDYSENQGRTDSRGNWHPPKHRSLIDSKPRHPNANDPPFRR